MKTITIIGGKLQGLEACYLGMKAGIKIVLIDKNPKAPARELASKFICADVLDEEGDVIEAFTESDMVLPTMENYDVLKGLERLSIKHGFIYAFDLAAYDISSSKKKSDKLFYDLKISAPRYYPEGRFPYIAKPDNESGSHNVTLIEDENKMREYISEYGNNMVIQEFVEGPSYSIEIVGVPGNYRTYEITQIHIDDKYDCNKVTAPCNLKKEKIAGFIRDAKLIAENINLSGIMDFEVIDCDDEFRMLEIDARVPSQTPTAVYQSTGVNLISELYDIFVLGSFKDLDMTDKAYTSFEHWLINDNNMSSQGEHIMTEGNILSYKENFMKSDEAITDIDINRNDYRITLINKSRTEKELVKKRDEVIKCLRNSL